MFNIIKTAALSAMIGLGALAAVPATAQADGLYLNFGGRHHQAGAGFHFGESRHGIRRHHNRNHRPQRQFRRHIVRSCSAGNALHKASRMGVRHARVASITRYSITVGGRKFQRHVRVRFGRGPGCPLIG